MGGWTVRAHSYRIASYLDARGVLKTSHISFLCCDFLHCYLARNDRLKSFSRHSPRRPDMPSSMFPRSLISLQRWILFTGETIFDPDICSHFDPNHLQPRPGADNVFGPGILPRSREPRSLILCVQTGACSFCTSIYTVRLTSNVHLMQPWLLLSTEGHAPYPAHSPRLRRYPPSCPAVVRSIASGQARRLRPTRPL